jgi:hypothetical protein
MKPVKAAGHEIDALHHAAERNRKLDKATLDRALTRIVDLKGKRDKF